MSVSNYERILPDARRRFLTFDQAEMIRRFSLKHDELYLYLPFIGQTHRIHRSSGLVEWLDKDGIPHEADFNSALSVYDVLCCSKPDCALSGQFAPINSVAKNYHTQNLGGSVFDSCPAFLSLNPDRLEQALLSLGGIREGKGDIACRINTFPFLPIRIQFWEADDEFPASLQILWDLNTLDYLHYETTYYVAGHLLHRLRELMAEDSYT